MRHLSCLLLVFAVVGGDVAAAQPSNRKVITIAHPGP